MGTEISRQNRRARQYLAGRGQRGNGSSRNPTTGTRENQTRGLARQRPRMLRDGRPWGRSGTSCRGCWRDPELPLKLALLGRRLGPRDEELRRSAQHRKGPAGELPSLEPNGVRRDRHLPVNGATRSNRELACSLRPDVPSAAKRRGRVTRRRLRWGLAFLCCTPAPAARPASWATALSGAPREVTADPPSAAVPASERGATGGGPGGL